MSLDKHKGATWTAKNGCVVSNKPTGHDDDENVRHYGGHLVAESIRDRETAELIAAAPDFKAAALMAMDGRSCSSTEIAISKGAWGALRDALAKSQGEDG